MRRALAYTTSCVLLAGCAALSGLDNLGVESPSDSDAGPQGSDATTATDGRPPVPPDASTEAAGRDLDADRGTDASADASITDVDTGIPSRWCATLATPPLLCADFDDGALPAGWTLKTSGDGARPVVNAQDSTSPPSSLLLSVPPSLAGGKSYLEQTMTLAATTEIRVAFAVRVNAIVTASDFELTTIRLGAAYELQLELIEGILSIEEEVPPPGTPPPAASTSLPMSLGAWHRIDLRIAFSNATSTLSISIDGGAPFTKPVSAVMFNAPPTIIVGHDSNSTELAMRYDNLIVDVR